MTKKTEEYLKRVESFWREKLDIYRQELIDYCKKRQRQEFNVSNDFDSPIIKIMDDMILEITKERVPAGQELEKEQGK